MAVCFSPVSRGLVRSIQRVGSPCELCRCRSVDVNAVLGKWLEQDGELVLFREPRFSSAHREAASQRTGSGPTRSTLSLLGRCSLCQLRRELVRIRAGVGGDHRSTAFSTDLLH